MPTDVDTDDYEVVLNKIICFAGLVIETKIWMAMFQSASKFFHNERIPLEKRCVFRCLATNF